jgi:hypothetical protein
MSVFDQACGVVERYFPELRKLFESVSVFHLDVTPGVDLPKKGDIAAEIVQEQLDTFFLPFPSVAIEDRGGVVILEDTRANQSGMSEFRNFINITMPERAEAASLGATEEQMSALRDRTNKSNPGRMIFVGGVIRVPHLTADQQFVIMGESRWFSIASKDALETPRTPAMEMIRRVGPRFQEETLRDAQVAVDEVRYLNQPALFVVEIAPANLRKPGPKIPRSTDRPIYTLLSPEQIKTRFLFPQRALEDRSKPTPHPRRRHYRTLRSEKYTNKRGSRILIPATWVGPEEATIGNKRYRVRLDL